MQSAFREIKITQMRIFDQQSTSTATYKNIVGIKIVEKISVLTGYAIPRRL